MIAVCAICTAVCNVCEIYFNYRRQNNTLNAYTDVSNTVIKCNVSDAKECDRNALAVELENHIKNIKNIDSEI